MLAGAIGLCVGSFLNVVIYRVPLGMSVVAPPSHCPKCDSPIRWYDNIPVLSYLILGGKCRRCGEPISFRYTAVEIGNCLLWLACVWRFSADSLPYALLCLPATAALVCVFCIDWEHQIIPDRFQILLGVLAIGATVFDPSPVSGGSQWWSHLIGLAAGFGVFFLLAVVAGKILGRDALGGGDIKLCAVMGLFLGWQKLLLSVLIASVAGSVIILLLRSRRRENPEFPFAPFLVSGFLISLLFGDSIMIWYLSLLF